MTTPTVSPVAAPTVLNEVSWDTYERLLADDPGRHAPRLTYDRGVLELMSPGSMHERLARLAALLVELVAVEWDIDVDDLGSTTFRQRALQRGFEPDGCFYFGDDAAAMRGAQDLDVEQQPPPNVVLEVDVTRSSIDKLALYASFDVPEVWRFHQERWHVLVLVDGAYASASASVALPLLTAEALDQFVSAGLRMPRTAWVAQVRAWAQGRTIG